MIGHVTVAATMMSGYGKFFISQTHRKYADTKAVATVELPSHCFAAPSASHSMNTNWMIV